MGENYEVVRRQMLVDQATNVLHDFLGTSAANLTKELVGQARVAASVYSTDARLKQTEGAVQALRFASAREVLSGDELRDYLRVSSPDMSLVKMLEVRKPEVNSAPGEEGAQQAG